MGLVMVGVRPNFAALKRDGRAAGSLHGEPAAARPGQWGEANFPGLGWLIQPGMTVVLNPNFVLSRHAENKEVYS